MHKEQKYFKYTWKLLCLIERNYYTELLDTAKPIQRPPE
jgi:hypothetical protein